MLSGREEPKRAWLTTFRFFFPLPFFPSIFPNIVSISITNILSMKLSPLIFCIILLSRVLGLHAQAPSVSLDYYLPSGTTYQANIPTPESVLGYQVGGGRWWHVSHDQLVLYMRTLAAASDRVVLKEYARSHEHRPLMVLLISSKENHDNLENIRQQHLALTKLETSERLKTEDMPIVVYQGYSIHGNEPSGSNAALLMAYYLAAAEGEEVEQLLQNAVILLDPSLNPDGMNRFANWVNMHKSKNPVADPNHREHHEVWPSGRTNHYWFDLNRDWLPVQHPESQGRIELFHQWKPNILTDHHEMGRNSTFFFQPGIPSRTNPLTPEKNQELTQKIAEFHAKALDEIGSMYYSKERFDDFYYGKGSTYPDANGCIGILFEQASSRGHIQSSIHGDLAFPFTIRNQVVTSFSTLKAAQSLRKELLDFQRSFFQSAREEARKDAEKAYIFSSIADRGRLHHFIELIHRHDIAIFQTTTSVRAEGVLFPAKSSYVVPLDQPQYRLIKAMFETRTSFTDSLFYDVSSWTLPLSFNLPYAPLNARQFSESLLGEKIEKPLKPMGMLTAGESDYGYLFEWDEYYASRAVNQLLKAGLIVKVGMKPFKMDINGGLFHFDYGTIFIPAKNQSQTPDELFALIRQAAEQNGLTVYAINTGLTPEGIDLGSPNFKALKQPKTMVLAGDGISIYDVGEVWHLLDYRYDMDLSIVEKTRFKRVELGDYTTIVLVGGNYSDIAEAEIEQLKRWLKNGGVLITMRSAIKWAIDKGLSNAIVKTPSEKKDKEGSSAPSAADKRPYTSMSAHYGAQVIGGAIFEATLDLTHPLGFGFNRDKIPVFKRGALFLQATNNPYAMPLVYTESPLLSGYISDKNAAELKNSASIVVSKLGKGRTISMADNPNFRAFWYGTNKLFVNALFFGHTISSGAAEGSGKK